MSWRIIQSDDEELEEALFQAGKHIPEAASLYMWLERGTLPNQKMGAGLMRMLAKFEPYAGKAKNDVFMNVLAWVNEVQFLSTLC